jgi:3-deoxy-7-phosphoheptulonate synthase
MLVVMSHDATAAHVARVVEVIEEMGYQARPMPGAQRTSVGLVGNDGRVDGSQIEALDGVAEVIHVTRPYKQVSREWQQENTLVTIAPGVVFGGAEIPIIAGPCSVENEAQIVTAAQQVLAAGASALRGGAFKPRSSPYSFQGLGVKGLELLALARRETGLPIVTEALDEEGAHRVAEVADLIQVGARNMQNYALLRTIGRLGKPVLLKRGMAATIVDLLLSAEYLLAEGNTQVILCERGIRSFDPSTRNLFDLTAIPLVQKLSHLPMIADPSHGTGQGAPDGPRRHRRGRRWPDRGSAPQPRPCPVRRRPDPLSGPVRAPRRRRPNDRRRHRPLDHAGPGDPHDVTWVEQSSATAIARAPSTILEGA